MVKTRFTSHIAIFFLLSVCFIGTTIPIVSAGSFSDEPSGFKHTGRVKLQLIYNWSISSDSGVPTSFEMWIPRIGNHSHPTMTGTAPVQSSLVVTNTTNMIPDTYHYEPKDDYNNTVEYYSVTVNPGEEFQYSIVYNLTLRETDWTIRERDEGEYDTDDPIYQNLTGAETHLEVDNTMLESLSNSICEGKTSISDKVNAIVKWMNKNLEFLGSMPAQGALLTYFSGGGDCSDFASFFVTMLRIQGIPARKCVGMQLYNYEKQEMYHNLKVGQEITYFSNKSGSVFNAGVPGHAWAEYYVPNYGFVSLDPTAVRSNKLKYMNFMDYTYVLSSSGENYGGGIDPAFPSNLIEWGILPFIQNPSSTNWAFSLKFTVLEKEGLIVIPKWGYLLILGGSSVAIAVTVNLIIQRRKQKKLEIQKEK